MAEFPSGSSVSEQHWGALVAEAHAAFSLVCSLKREESSAHAPNDDLILVSQSHRSILLQHFNLSC
jgi:hypothetical protein